MQSNKPKLHSLESLRGIAAICVVYFHSEFAIDTNISLFRVNSAIWVDFFFILSGFVMGYAYYNRIINKEISLLKFITLRFGRLAPLNIFILLCWIPYVALKYYAYHHGYINIDPNIKYSLSSFFTNLFLVQSFNLHETGTWNGPSWSISTEFYTYLVMFFILSSVKSKILNNLSFFLLISIISYFTLLYFSDSYYFSSFKYGFFRCLGGFFLGIFVYQIYTQYSKFLLGIASDNLTINLIEIVLFVACIFLISNLKINNYYIFTIILVFAFIILTLSIQHKGVISKILQSKILLFLGKISYSIYLTHALILLGFTKIARHYFKMPSEYNEYLNRNIIFYEYSNILNLILLMLVVFISSITYKYIELPFRDKFIKLANK